MADDDDKRRRGVPDADGPPPWWSISRSIEVPTPAAGEEKMFPQDEATVPIAQGALRHAPPAEEKLFPADEATVPDTTAPRYEEERTASVAWPRPAAPPPPVVMQPEPRWPAPPAPEPRPMPSPPQAARVEPPTRTSRVPGISDDALKIAIYVMAALIVVLTIAVAAVLALVVLG